ncbi:MAG: hypothetical protein VX269_10815 [Verrucomicrobiota bacterium]|nr:hypothetical protein [Verrucomicrobiota bacterium]MEE3177834.1 hypothetical protein [Verrucomicrobiota bacterium]
MTRHIYTQFFSLQVIGIILGVILVILHVIALSKRESVMDFLKQLPRNKNLGIVVLAIDCIWSFWLIGVVDLGEFQKWENPIRIGLPLGFICFIIWVNEFLAVRAVGIFLLLLACPFLDAAFLQEPSTRVLIPILCYVWIFLSLFWIGMPYLMRDHIALITKTKGRWTILSVGGIVYGFLMIVCAFAFWGIDKG